MINTTKFPLELSHHDSFRSCHLKLADDSHICNFMDADFFHWGGISTLFLEWNPSKNANIFSRYYAYFGKTLNIYIANIST